MVELGSLLCSLEPRFWWLRLTCPAGPWVAGGAALAGGAAIALAGAGGGAAVVIGAVLGVMAATGLWLAFATRKALATRRLRSASGREALMGPLRRRAPVAERRRPGVRGRRALARAAELAGQRRQLDAGDAIVVERVTGLTLGVRRAEEWEEV